jgi:hypothetical protein
MFDTEAQGNGLLISAKISHAAGHSETRSLLLPMDAQGAKSPVQGVGSTVAYGRRYLTKLLLNLVERGEDDDGQGGPITEAQAADLRGLLEEVKADRGKFLVFMGVGDVKDILAKDMKKAVNALETKRRAG